MLEIKKISKVYHNFDREFLVLDEISFNVQEGEIVTIFGPNGSGKSTLFNIIAGLEKPSEGQVLFGDKVMENVNVGFVFQNYNDSMFPWLSVLDNVLFQLDNNKIPRTESLLKAEYVLKKVRLWDHRDKYIYQLSGGMRQLVAIARAFIIEPEFLLMDEPCSSLDYQATKKTDLELLNLWQDKKITTIVISHDIDEAVFLADRIFVFSKGPGKIKTVINVDLPRPRTLEMFQSEKFFEIRSKVLAHFMYE